MPLVVKDRVRETTTTLGTGTITLAGAVAGFQSFSAIGNANTTYYTINLPGANEWEVGIGTYTASGTTLSRDTILASSNGGSAVNFSAGTKDVFCTYPAGRSVYYDTSTNVTLNALTLSGGTANGVVYLNASKVATTGSALTFDGTALAPDNTTRTLGTSSLRWGTVFATSFADGTDQLIGSSGTTVRVGYGASWTAQSFAIGGTEQMRLTSSGLEVKQSQLIGYSSFAGIGSNGLAVLGNVGIGTNAPAYKLDVLGSSYVVGRFLRNGTTTASGGVQVGNNSQVFTIYGDSTGLSIENTTANTTPLILNTSGNLGIGTNAPGYKLDVVNNSTNIIGRLSSSYAFGTALQLSNSSTGGGSWTLYSFGQSNGEGAGNFGIANVAGNKLTLDSSGNLGLGVTPSVWYSNRTALQLGNAVSAITGDSQFELRSNAFLNASAVETYINSYWANKYVMSAGIHAWYTAPSGTAGNPISFTQAMTLDASGNFVVGSTNPDPFARTDQRLAAIVGTSSGDNAALSISAGASAGRGAQIYMGQSSTRHFTLVANLNESRLGTTSNTPLILTTNDTERARITSGGYFKASNSGAYNGAANLYHENYNSASDEWITWFQSAPATNPKGLRVYYSAAAPNGTANHFLYCDDTGGQRASIRSNGGLANYQSNNVDLSDARTKTDINPLGSYWSKIAGLEIVTYKYKDQTHDDLNIGVIAQQVEQVAPEFVDSDGFGDTPEDGVPLKTIYNKDLTFAAIKALQEAMARIETLEAEVAALKGA